MLSITCTLARKSRRPQGGVSYIFNAVAQHFLLQENDREIDLERAHVTISDFAEAQYTLRPEPLSKAEKGATKIVAGRLGDLYISVYVSPAQADEIFGDLEKALTEPSLLVALTVGEDLQPSDRAFFQSWLAGKWHSEDMTLWSDRMPEIGLVIRR